MIKESRAEMAMPFIDLPSESHTITYHILVVTQTDRDTLMEGTTQNVNTGTQGPLVPSSKLLTTPGDIDLELISI